MWSANGRVGTGAEMDTLCVVALIGCTPGVGQQRGGVFKVGLFDQLMQFALDIAGNREQR